MKIDKQSKAKQKNIMSILFMIEIQAVWMYRYAC
ncbi:MAG: hypothetical protein ACI9LM_005449, partial [Alteromonadaceae bacterium]